MVCIQGITGNRIRKSLTNYDLEKYPLYSWVIFKLSNYIYKKYDGAGR